MAFRKAFLAQSLSSPKMADDPYWAFQFIELVEGLVRGPAEELEELMARRY
jgi:hypothetical protein